MSIANKKQIVRKQISDSHGCNGVCSKCIKIYNLIDKMEEAKIPSEYWLLKMANFSGPNKIKDILKDYIQNIKTHYSDGAGHCFVGGYGIGKTFTACTILKKALSIGFDAYYISASDMMNSVFSDHSIKDKLKTVDFLVIDEMDSRFFTSPVQKDMFGSLYETVFRHRCQNKFPTIICSNDTNNIMNVFGEQNSQSIQSLHNKYLNIIYVAGKDLRGAK